MRRSANQPILLWIRLAFMTAALVGILYAISYFKSGKAFQDPNSPAQILIGEPTPPPASAPAPQNR